MRQGHFRKSVKFTFTSRHPLKYIRYSTALAFTCICLFSSCQYLQEPTGTQDESLVIKSGVRTLSKTTPTTKILFGPERFIRNGGKPVTETRTLTIPNCVGLTAPFILHLRNGNSDGTNRVSSATVSLDNEIIFGPSNFSQQVAGYDVEVTVLGQSILTITLKGAPGSLLDIWIDGILEIPQEALAAFYPFTGNASDESGNGNNGIVNGATLTNDRFGNPSSAYFFDGNDFIEMGNVLNLGIDGSISVWWNPADVSRPNNVLVTKGGSGTPGTDVAYAFWLGDSGHMVGQIRSAFVKTPDNVVNENNRWYHVAYRFDSLRHALFVDGQKLAESNHGITPGDHPNTFYLGRFNGFRSDLNAVGIIDDIRVYDRALTDCEVQALSQE